MAIPLDRAMLQVRRLHGLPGSPAMGSEQERQCAEALAETAASEVHADLVITRLWRGDRAGNLDAAQYAKEQRFHPAPVDFEQVALRNLSHEEDEPTPSTAGNCQRCNGTGFEPIAPRSGYSFVKVCNCRK